jgi:hypothetical protein
MSLTAPGNPLGMAYPQKRYLHISYGFNDIPRLQNLAAVFTNLSDDWLRYTNQSWIAWTNNEPTTWFNALKPHLKVGEYLLILELKMNQGIVQGMLPQFGWDWLNKPRY